jgi:transposase-like protein
MPPEIDERTIERIAEQVAGLLRRELEDIVAELGSPNGSGRPLTVEEVAERFGVARSTVYAHWREWGGYKLGAGDKAPIRFNGTALSRLRVHGDGDETLESRRRGDLLGDDPALDQLTDRDQ